MLVEDLLSTPAGRSINIGFEVRKSGPVRRKFFKKISEMRRHRKIYATFHHTTYVLHYFANNDKFGGVILQIQILEGVPKFQRKDESWTSVVFRRPDSS